MIAVKKPKQTLETVYLPTNMALLWKIFLLWLPKSVVCDNYYDYATAGTYEDCEFVANGIGRHLASVHTSDQNQQITELCETYSNIQPKRCWIGLEIEVVDNETISKHWTDGTDIELSIVDQSWCSGYPIINNYVDNRYYTYIDATNNCWRSTENSSLVIGSIFGPRMWDITGLYWTVNAYIPLILSIIGFPSSICVVVYLVKNLYIIDHIWVEMGYFPTKFIKCSAILIPIMICIASIFGMIATSLLLAAYQQTGVMVPSSFIDSDYPDIYRTMSVFWAMCIAVIYFYTPLGYIHVKFCVVKFK